MTGMFDQVLNTPLFFSVGLNVHISLFSLYTDSTYAQKTNNLSKVNSEENEKVFSPGSKYLFESLKRPEQNSNFVTYK